MQLPWSDYGDHLMDEHHTVQLGMEILVYFLPNMKEFMDSLNSEILRVKDAFYYWEDTLLFMYHGLCIK